MIEQPAADTHAALRARLDQLAEKGTEFLASSASNAALSRAWKRTPWLLLVVPGLCFFIQLVQWIHGDARWQPAWYGLIFATVAVPAIALFVEWWMTRGVTVARVQAFGLFDDRLELADRLNTADAFLRIDERSDFMEAAVDDANEASTRALSAAIAPPAVVRPAWADAQRPVLVALLMLVAVILLGEHVPHGMSIRRDSDTVADAGDAAPGRAEDPPSERLPDPDETVPTKVEPETQVSGEPGDAKRAVVNLEHDAKKTDGKTGAGQTSAAESMSGANDARGTPTNQGPSSKSKSKKSKSDSAKKPAKKDTADPAAPPKKDLEEQSGATAGKGSSKGSNKNPVATSWKSKDDVAPDEEDELEDDEDVEDEESESEARGGMQPNLRDRRPPVSRDLSIGFGNQPSPDANGRGGPSEQKKSRGTASLVLGVPIPDRVKGQPNAGRTKVTQERVEPRREDADPIAAGDRTPRSEPVGPVPMPRLSPWLKDLVRTYFLTLRENGRGDS